MPIFQLSDELLFPDPSWAASEGLLAVGGDLSPQRLVLAYQLGIFPWYGENQPIMWWSPDPRCVLFPHEIHISKRLNRILKQQPFQLTCNKAFKEVIDACAMTRLEKGEDTWLIDEMKSAYEKLHTQGYAHSIEAWQDGNLAGGLYGIAFGKFFFGESMFSLQTNASKIILVELVRYMEQQGFVLLDCQVPNPHLMRMGARNIPREEFLKCLSENGLGPEGEVRKVEMPDGL